jgi:hypothetical protein
VVDRENLRKRVFLLNEKTLKNEFYICLDIILSSQQENFKSIFFFNKNKENSFYYNYESKLSLDDVIIEIFSFFLSSIMIWESNLRIQFEKALINLATDSVKWSQGTHSRAVELILAMRQGDLIEKPILKETGKQEAWNFSKEQFFEISMSNKDVNNSLVEVITEELSI